MNNSDAQLEEGTVPLAELKLVLPEHLQRAFQRCVWIRVNETGQSQLAIMEEMIRDFLIKHGC